MVRLEEWFHSSSNRANDKFQFHDGAIRRNCAYFLNSMIVRFNSTMVRLEEHQPRFFRKIQGSFNSTMVRLEVSAIRSLR